MPLSKCAGQNKGFGWNGDPEANHRTKKKRYNSFLELKSSASVGPLQAGMTIGLKGGKNKLWCADDAGARPHKMIDFAIGLYPQVGECTWILYIVNSGEVPHATDVFMRTQHDATSTARPAGSWRLGRARRD